MTPMGGIFNTPLRFRNPQMGGGGIVSPPSSPPTGTGQIMPPGAPMGDPSSAQQNNIMPQGAVMGAQPPPNMQQDTQSPLTQPDFTARAPIMNPNHGYMLDAMKAGAQNPQNMAINPGVPQANTPSANMQNVPYWMNQLLQNGG